MIKSQIERLLHLQNAAYETLLWINRRAEYEQELLSDENLAKWRYAETCEAWVRDIHGMIPSAVRPSEADIPAFAHLFSSFFQTSFRLVESSSKKVSDSWGEEYWAENRKRKLMPGAVGEKKSTKGKARAGESAQELRIIALEDLAIENEIFPSRAELESLAQDAQLRDALVLWTYIHELNRRANFSSQGEAVRLLWQAMEKKERIKLNADKVMKARESLLAALKG